ncbi:2609_t:CDS:1 [Funneliformis geosporum]|uniref:13176_t:CDS:1 n=1 Tax=Funneliformis geosporum TaxID=1117311 RepID=A0A9W4WIC2_9GLOM|nr:2609_t:CDS:1 [Funneliformis geosporum]CAI2163890.1 13176_t:CDS:1 [Funneliformis geosporum]
MGHTGAPYSPPPSPPKSPESPKSGMWLKMNDGKVFSHKSTELGVIPKSIESVTQQPLLNSNVVIHPYDIYSKTSANVATYETQIHQIHDTRIYETKSETSKLIEKPPQVETQKLSKMSITFMLDNPRDETTSLPTTKDDSELGKEIDRKVYAGRKRRGRKNPYPMRAPPKDAPGINHKVDVYMKDPAVIMRSNVTSTVKSSTKSSANSVGRSYTPLQTSSKKSDEIESNHEPMTDKGSKVGLKSKGKPPMRRQRQSRRSGAVKPERKRKGNSLARVMADRGLLESIFNAVIASDIKSVRIPPPQPMQHQELMKAIKELNVDHSILDNYTPSIAWKGQPLNISHLPHYEDLHETEASVVSILRLTPVQYLTGKHTLVSAANRYIQRNLPFKKSDAQKLLRIDVNKASKLWEFFRQVRWI